MFIKFLNFKDHKFPSSSSANNFPWRIIIIIIPRIRSAFYSTAHPQPPDWIWMRIAAWETAGPHVAHNYNAM